jgi:hypothetical protein
MLLPYFTLTHIRHYNSSNANAVATTRRNIRWFAGTVSKIFLKILRRLSNSTVLILILWYKLCYFSRNLANFLWGKYVQSESSCLRRGQLSGACTSLVNQRIIPEAVAGISTCQYGYRVAPGLIAIDEFKSNGCILIISRIIGNSKCLG